MRNPGVFWIIMFVLRNWHERLGAKFCEIGASEAVADYGDASSEHAAIRDLASIFDLSFRGRLCLTGADRKRFLHGQVTNEVSGIQAGAGVYAALVTAKGKMISDLNIYMLDEEILIDLEPGLSQTVAERLEKFIISEDVQVIDAAPHYGLLSVQGPRASETVSMLGPGKLPEKGFNFQIHQDVEAGEIYLMNNPRFNSMGYDLYVPVAGMEGMAEKLKNAVKVVGGRFCGWRAYEMARIEAGVPRFGADMDSTNLPPEAGIERRAVSYSKGCYIGQEVIARIRTYGQVAKALRGLHLADGLAELPRKGDKLFKDGKEAGFITSALASPTFRVNIALGYVRREYNSIGTELTLRTDTAESTVRIVALPFGQNFA
jgi:folate-binding protein YgfZ